VVLSQPELPAQIRRAFFAFFSLGMMQVAIGALCILISSILVSMWSTTPTDKGGAGIWCGVFVSALCATFSPLSLILC